MSALLTLCGGFLLAVLWMDLMFDVQVLRCDPVQDLPEEVLTSIAAYYRRVTTLARPMNRAIAGMMIVLLLALLVQIIGGAQRWVAVASAPFCSAAIVLAALRVVPNAVRLGSRLDAVGEQSRLARAIYRDHLLCISAMAAFVALQLCAALR